jgi:hypothetical protein
MSYDIRFGVKVAGADDCYAVIGRPEYDSPTYNLRDIFVRSMDWDYHQGEWYKITEVLPRIKHGIIELTLHPQRYIKLEPESWGTIGNAIKCLLSVVDYFSADNWDADVPIDCIYMRW